MANVPKAITDLPVASAMGDDDLLVVSQNATTSSIKGELIKGYAQNAVASQVTAAQTAANQAGQSATQAEAAGQGAAAAQTAAESAQDAAETARDQSVAAAGTIGDSVEQAQTAAGQASSAKDAAVAAQSAAETAKTAAETASGQAQTAATQAAGSATAAQTAATQAGDAKTDAETARNEAETSASSAANSASDAESAATEAEQAKTYIENMDMDGETLPAGSSVTVTKTTSPEGNLLFVIGVPQGIQGETGPTGASVDHIERTSGTGAPGTTDTYTVYLTDGQTGGTFQVYNGSNGTGSGDFMADGSVPMTGDLQMGGHKITNLAEPTDNTDAASKEYVDDTITVSLVGNYIPMGQKGQANGVASLDGSGKVPNEQLPPMDCVPTSRTVNGHALSADVTLDAEDVGARPDTWTPSAEDVGAIPNPTGGTAGQVLTKTETGEEWSDAPSGLPEGGTEGQVIKKTADGAEWGNADWLPLNGGTMSGDIAMGGHKITNLGAPTNANDAVRQADLKVVSDEVDGIISGTTGITLAPATTTKIGGVIVGDGIEVEADGTISVTPGLTQEQADDRYLQLSGGTLTGALTLNGEPTEGLQAAPKQYVDALKPLARTITLTAAGWSSNAQTVTVSGVSASETAQLITPTPAIASQSAYYEAGIMCTGQAANSLTFTCQTVPTSNLTVYVVIQRLN